jgi:hypothetical protein
VSDRQEGEDIERLRLVAKMMGMAAGRVLTSPRSAPEVDVSSSQKCAQQIERRDVPSRDEGVVMNTMQRRWREGPWPGRSNGSETTHGVVTRGAGFRCTLPAEIDHPAEARTTYGDRFGCDLQGRGLRSAELAPPEGAGSSLRSRGPEAGLRVRGQRHDVRAPVPQAIKGRSLVSRSAAARPFGQ